MGTNLYKGVVGYTTQGTNSTPYNDMLKVWDEYVGEEKKDKKIWRMVAFVSMAISLIMIGTVYYALSLPKTVPYYVEIAPWGEARAVGPTGSTTYNITDQVKVFHIRRFIEYIRTVPTDQNIMVNNFNKAYEVLTKNSGPVVTAELQTENVYAMLGRLRRNVMVETIINITGQAWQVDWVETTVEAQNNREVERKRNRAIVTIIAGEPKLGVNSENPLGIYIDSYQRQTVEASK